MLFLAPYNSVSRDCVSWLVGHTVCACSSSARGRHVVGRQATATTDALDIICCAALLVVLPQVHVVKRDGSNQLLQTYDSKPSYAELEAALKTYPEAASNKSLMDRIRDEVQFIQDTAQQPGQKKD